jgi:pilus assembly protein Flp/PilA
LWALADADFWPEKTVFLRFAKNESGATSIEYGLIAAIVSVGIIAALKLVKTSLQSTFTKVSTDLTAANK